MVYPAAYLFGALHTITVKLVSLELNQTLLSLGSGGFLSISVFVHDVDSYGNSLCVLVVCSSSEEYCLSIFQYIISCFLPYCISNSK